MSEEKRHIVQENIPGKQVTFAHIIRNPRKDLCELIGVENRGAIGIMTITPSQGAIIAADIGSKAGAVHLEFIDRFTGCLVLSGDVSSIEAALVSIVRTLESVLGFGPCEVTRT